MIQRHGNVLVVVLKTVVKTGHTMLTFPELVSEVVFIVGFSDSMLKRRLIEDVFPVSMRFLVMRFLLMLLLLGLLEIRFLLLLLLCLFVCLLLLFFVLLLKR